MDEENGDYQSELLGGDRDAGYLEREALSFEEELDCNGDDYEDEFFGPQQIYRKRFFVTIPYTVSGERPASAEPRPNS